VPLLTVLGIGLLLNFVVHKKIKLGIYSSLLLLAEFMCVIGIIAASQRILAYGWIIDTPTIIGLIVLTGSDVEFAFSLNNRNAKRFLKFFEIGIFVFSFLILFTPWKGFGLAIITGMIIRILIMKNLYEELKKII